MGKPNTVDPILAYVPPSQQTMPGPVPKPGELLPEVAEKLLKERLEQATVKPPVEIEPYKLPLDDTSKPKAKK